MACGEDRADVYVYLIRDHKEAIIRQMDIDTILDIFPYKECISESEFRSLTTQTDSIEKSKLFVNFLLNKKEESVLEAFLQLLIQSNSNDGLWFCLRDRLARFEEKKEENQLDVSSEASVASASIYNESEHSLDNSPSRTEDQLKDELEKAKEDLENKKEEIRRLEGRMGRVKRKSVSSKLNEINFKVTLQN
ncbi:uncharacterized protein [Haliotis asinina]|uniref:uncharacterized protein n=1 Tax=Haliotis asinina TaxID=109174 RepID=UPI003531A152